MQEGSFDFQGKQYDLKPFDEEKVTEYERSGEYFDIVTVLEQKSIVKYFSLPGDDQGVNESFGEDFGESF